MNILPNVAYEGDNALAHQYLPAAKQLLGQVREQMRFNRLGILRGHRRLSDSAYCYVVVAGELASIRIVADGSEQAVPDWVSEHWKTPDFLSGVVANGLLNSTPTGTAICNDFLPTPECARLFKLNAKDQAGLQASAKLAVEPYVGIADINPFDPNRYTQYAYLRPTLWTGTLRKGVQALMGFGKPGRKSIYAEAKLIPKLKVKLVKPSPPSAYERQVAQYGRQIRYDYRFYRTHGLVRAEDNQWWLVEIGLTRGVVAMPLPLYPDTTPTATGKTAELFRHKLITLNDGAARTVIEQLGGLPTGEAFPGDPNEFEAWVRAGKILRLAPAQSLTGFYDYQPYSSLMGWAFSTSGREAHNTAWDYGDNGVIVGIHEAIRLRIGVMSAPLRSVAAIKSLRDALRPLEKLYPRQYNAAVWKLRRLSALDFNRVVDELSQWGAQAAFTLLDGMTGLPLASGTAMRTRISTGNLWDNARPGFQVQLKFPEPALGALLSFDFNPNVPDPLNSPAQECDTTVQVFFRDETLHWVKYFCSPKTVAASSTSESDECMYIGSWTTATTTEGGIPKMLYTSERDDRREVGGSQNTTTITGEDIGYTETVTNDELDNIQFCSFFRVKTFLMKTVTERFDGPRLASTVLFPFGDRASYYYAVVDGYTAMTRAESYSYKKLSDPWIAYGFRAIWQPDWLSECGRADRRRCYEIGYIPGPCSDLADEGLWLKKCDDLDDMAFAWEIPDLPPSSTRTTTSMTLEVILVSAYADSPVRIREATSDNPYWGMEQWFTPSPEPNTNWLAHLWTTQNTLGEANILQYSDNPGTNNLQAKGNPWFAQLANHFATFVGVV
jgi:hypothetical protein